MACGNSDTCRIDRHEKYRSDFLDIKIKGWRQLRAKILKNNNIIRTTESFLALSLRVSLHFQLRF